MADLRFFRILVLLPVLVFLTDCTLEKKPHERVYSRFDTDLDALIRTNEQFLEAVTGHAALPELQREFLALRLEYKKTEAFAAYFNPTTVRVVNGAPLDEIEEAENAVFEPGGLQVIEALLFTEAPVERQELIRQVRKLLVNIRRIKMLWQDIEITDSHVFDALRLGVFRLITLGVSGFDTPLSGNALAESEVVLRSLQVYLTEYSPVIANYPVLDSRIDAAIAFVQQHRNFMDFDRATFIVKYVNPVSVSLNESQKQAGIPFIRARGLLRGDAATLFEKNAFDPEALVTNARFAATAARRELGRALFYEGMLSGDGRTSCGTCHQPQRAFTDGLKTSKGLNSGSVKRNAPTVLYAGLQQALFYDMRAPSLEDQAITVIHNEQEMNGSLTDIARLLHSDSSYRELFRKAYPEEDSVQPLSIQNALAVFIRSLGAFDAPFDHFMRGDTAALTADQVSGFNLFMDKGRCGTCHFIPLFNGTVPPDFRKTEAEVLGVTIHPDWKQPVLDEDTGRDMHGRYPQWTHAFKTGTLRNVGKTAPYMHNGAYSTLEEVLEFYNEGGGAGLGLDVPNQTLPADKLNLTPSEQKQLVAFLESLTDS